MLFVYFFLPSSSPSFTLYQTSGVVSSGHAIMFAHLSAYQRLDTFVYHRMKSKRLFFLLKGRNEGWMNELNECIALLGVSGSLDWRNKKFFVHIVKEDL